MGGCGGKFWFVVPAVVFAAFLRRHRKNAPIARPIPIRAAPTAIPATAPVPRPLLPPVGEGLEDWVELPAVFVGFPVVVKESDGRPTTVAVGGDDVVLEDSSVLVRPRNVADWPAVEVVGKKVVPDWPEAQKTWVKESLVYM